VPVNRNPHLTPALSTPEGGEGAELRSAIKRLVTRRTGMLRIGGRDHWRDTGKEGDMAATLRNAARDRLDKG